MSAAVDSARKRCSCGRSIWQNFNTKCQNLKCACFRDGLHCIRGRCKCKGCENNPDGLAIDVLPTKCSCKSTRCKYRVCPCFREDSRCTGLCKCVGCENNPEGRAYEGGKGCTCQFNKCKKMNCGCLKRGARCTLKCSCQGCENGKGTGGEAADKSNAGAGEQGQVTPEVRAEAADKSNVVRAEAADKSNAGAGEQEKQPISPMLEQKQPTSDTGGSGTMSSGKAIETSSKRPKLSSDDIAEHDANLPSL